jgi:TPR repeat protein
MVRLVAVLVVLVAAGKVRADELVWPTDPEVRINAQIAACGQGQAAVCLEVAAELGRRGITSRAGYTPASLRARATKLLDEQCAAGTAASCFEHGRFLANRGDVATGIAKMKRGCELGSGAACVYLASREKKAKRVMELLERACTLDNAHGCEAVAAKIENKDPSRASTLRRKACDGGDATACSKTAAQKRAAGDKAGAFADFESACELKLTARADGAELAACDHAGSLATDAARARELFKSACDAGHAPACIHLGERVARGEGGERDWGAGLALVADGCKRTRDTRCKPLADLKKHPPDWQCSTYEQCRTHCEEQLWPACRRIVELDKEEVDAEWLARACTGGDAIGCRMLGDADSSFKTALPHYQKACKLRDATACRYAQLGRALGGSKADVALLRSACGTDRATCALYGLAIARKDKQQAAKVLREACDHKVGVACRYLARTFDGSSSSGTDAMIELVIGAPQAGGATCDCESAPPQRSRKEADDDQQRYDESQRLLRLGCAAGDALSCEDTRGPDRVETPPARPVVLPAWQ